MRMTPVCATTNAIGSVASNTAEAAGNAMLNSFAHAMAEAFGNMVKIMVTFWVNIPTPGLPKGMPGEKGNPADYYGPVAQLHQHLAWYMTAAAMIGLLMGAGKLALARDGGATLRETGKGLTRWILLAAGGTAAVGIATTAGDKFSVWIIDRAAGADLGAALAPYVGIAHLIGPLGSMLVAIVGFIAVVGALIQTLLMFVRSAMLVILAGVLPLAAAAGIGGGAGKKTLDKVLSWLVAFVLYKPVAAIVYAAAFWTVGDSDNIIGQLTGIFMIAMAAAAMPALMRAVTPAVEATTSAGSGAGAAVGAAGSAATSGARMVGSGGKSGGSGSMGGKSGGGGLTKAGGTTGTAATGAATAGVGTAASFVKGAHDGVKFAATSGAQHAGGQGQGQSGTGGQGQSGTGGQPSGATTPGQSAPNPGQPQQQQSPSGQRPQGGQNTPSGAKEQRR